MRVHSERVHSEADPSKGVRVRDSSTIRTGDCKLQIRHQSAFHPAVEGAVRTSIVSNA